MVSRGSTSEEQTVTVQLPVGQTPEQQLLWLLGDLHDTGVEAIAR